LIEDGRVAIVRQAIARMTAVNQDGFVAGLTKD
jgi:hypothetical protein